MKIERLVIGNTYYIPHGTYNYKKVVLEKLLDDKQVLLKDNKGNMFRCSINKLHTMPYKAVKGYKARERIKQKIKEVGKANSMKYRKSGRFQR